MSEEMSGSGQRATVPLVEMVGIDKSFPGVKALV